MAEDDRGAQPQPQPPGVPLSAQDLERGNDPPNESAEIRQSESEPRRVRATVQPPTEKTHGVIVEATYTTIGNTIRVRDLTGRLYVERFKPGDDLDHLARKLLRQHGPNSFYDPIAYPKSYH